MSLANLLPQTVTISRPDGALVDNEGNPVAARSTVATSRARLQLLASVEQFAQADTVSDRWLCFLPAGVDITAGDEVSDGTTRFVVDGTPNRVFAAAAEHHIEAVLRYDSPVPSAPTAETFGYGEGGYGENYYGGSAA